MRLSERLEEILLLCGSGFCAADVGTDHGLVPVELVSRGCFEKAIAMDVREGPLSRARAHIRERRLEGRIETRLSDGLSLLSPGEADVIVLAGMGGPLMGSLLETGRASALAAGRLVLSPQSDVPAFRKTLHALGFLIREERFLEEDGKVYHLMMAAPGREEPWTEPEYRYGKQLLEERHPLLRRELLKEIRQKRELAGALSSGSGERALERLRELQEELMMAEQALERFPEA